MKLLIIIIFLANTWWLFVKNWDSKGDDERERLRYIKGIEL